MRNLFILLLFFAKASFAMPEAGSLIENQAMATYSTATGESLRVHSNALRVVVQAVYATRLETPQQRTIPPGSSVTLPQRLTHLGNSICRYRLSSDNPERELLSTEFWLDANTNGQLDAADLRLTAETLLRPNAYQQRAAADLRLTGEILLKPGESIDFFVKTTAPPQGLRQENTLRVTANCSDNSEAQSTHVLRPVNGGSRTLNKTVAETSVRAQDLLNYTLNLAPLPSNSQPANIRIDGQNESAFVLRDALPANTYFVKSSNNQNLPLLYQIAGDPEQSFRRTPPADSRAITALALAFPALSNNLRWQVQLQVSPAATGLRMLDIENTAVLFERTGSFPSNLVETPVVADANAPPARIEYFVDNTFRQIDRRAMPGETLFIGAFAPICNTSSQSVEGQARTIRIRITSLLTGDNEVFTAIESLPNTETDSSNSGWFYIRPPLESNYVPTAESLTAIVGNGILETIANDFLTATLKECDGRQIAVQTRILIDPLGVVFDSRSNAPVAGAQVTLIDESTGQPALVFADDGITQAPSTVTTGIDGRFRFPLVNPGRYRLQVIPPDTHRFPSTVAIADLPAGRLINVQGSYGGVFPVDLSTGVVTLDIPVDPQVLGELFLEKSVEKPNAFIGESLLYRLRLKNNTNQILNQIILFDLPALGLRYIEGSSRLAGQRIEDPTVDHGRWRYSLPSSMEPGETFTLEYRMQVLAQALSGNGQNRAQAQGQSPDGLLTSNEARAQVTIEPGIFDDRAYILGRVYLDCHQAEDDKNARPEATHPEDLGVPGVRLYLQDGSFVITDRQGQFSFYGLRPRTQILKLDPITLPEHSEIILSSFRQALDPGSFFIDLKRGELAKADFALRCTSSLKDSVLQRQKEASSESELTLQLNKNLTIETLSSSSETVRGKAASGTIDHRTPTYFKPLAPSTPTPKAFKDSMPSLETVLLQNPAPSLAFLNLQDGDILPTSTQTIRLKGSFGAELRLFINEQLVSPKQLGKVVKVPDSQLQGYEFVAVKLSPGENILRAEQRDPFGNPRGSVSLRVIAPGEAAQLTFVVPEGETPADGSTPVLIQLTLTDVKGTPVTARNFITLETSLGKFLVEDLDTKQPGIQVFIEGGQGEFPLLPPRSPGKKATLRANDGRLEAEATVAFTPALRPLILVGVVEGVIDLKRIRSRNFQPSSQQDGFEEQLTGIFKSETDDLYRGGVRASLFLKGKVLGKYLLTAAYDSDKKDEALFRDIDPNRYYPIYGDDSIKGFDAQSTGKLYLKLERGNSFVLFGDFQSGLANAGIELGRYQRNVSGGQINIENNRLQLRAFAARTDAQFIEEELPARGISGPYLLARRLEDIVENSEIVTLVTRRRDQNAVILKEVAQRRLEDYVLDRFSGGIVFNQAIPSLDSDLNPVFIRVRYEVEGGEMREIYGANLQAKVTENIEVGLSYAKDEDTTEPTEILGANLQIQLGDKTRLTIEGTQSDTNAGEGNAYRMDLQREGEKVNFRLRYSDVDTDFNNPAGSATTPGRQELSLQGSAKLGSNSTLRTEAFISESKQNQGQQQGAYLGLEQNLSPSWQGTLGLRYSKASDVQNMRGQTLNEDFVSGRFLLRYRPQTLTNLSVFADYEQAFSGDGKVFALGGDYALSSRSRLYLRHEFINSLSGRYGLDSEEARNITVFGLEREVLGNGLVYSEYRVRETIDGRSNQAALGLRNTWNLREGLALETQLERSAVLSGANSSDLATSIALGLAYTRPSNWKATTRLEYRRSQGQDDWLYNLGIAARLTQNWSFLGRNYYQRSNSSNDRRLRNRLQLGVAYRPANNNRWQSLWRYEWRLEEDAAADFRRSAQIFSLHGHYEINPRWVAYGRLAAKYVEENFSNQSVTYDGYLLSARSTYDLGSRFQIGILGSILSENGGQGYQYGLGGEIGFIVSKNLIFQLGYNLQGYEDKDFSDWEYTARGPYLRLRYKFDEGLIRRPPAPPAPPAAAVVVTPPPAPTFQMVHLSADVLFAFGQSTLSSQGKQALEKLVAQWQKSETSRLEGIEITGHSDRIGGDAANLRLSQARADSVKDFLVALGIPSSQIQSRGLGESTPVSRCEESLRRKALIACLSQDRRVDIRLRYQSKL